MTYPHTEETCPGHVATEGDPKVCALCGTHIDSLSPDDQYEEEDPDREPDYDAPTFKETYERAWAEHQKAHKR